MTATTSSPDTRSGSSEKPSGGAGSTGGLHDRLRAMSARRVRRDLLLGTFLGRGGVVTAAIAVGFLPAFVLLVLQSETTPLFAVFVFFVTAVLFGLLFVGF